MVKPHEKLGNYEIMAAADGSALVLGSGAGGVTYRGKHVHLGTEVAVKVLIRRKNLLQKDRDAFLSEARSAASLAHPHIARILDFGESAQQHPYYVMELCEGGSLEEFGQQPGPPDAYVCIQWFFESASALAYAHQKGIVHRDIKPSNLLVARQDAIASVRLIDFGLADHARPDESRDDHVIGTPHFAAPEQLRGQAGPASDVFSLAATFFWLLTGKHLSQGDVKAVISERLEATSYAPLVSTLPTAWQALLGPMLEVDPDRRPRDGAESLAAAQAAFPHHPLQPVPWQETGETSAAGPSAVPPSHWQDHANAAWSDVWQETGAPISIDHGFSLIAIRNGESVPHDVLRFPGLAPEISEILVRQGNLVARHAGELGLGTVRLDHGENWWSVAWPALGNDDALSWVRQGQSANTAEILAALEPIAAALDHLLPAGFDHLEIHPSMLVVHPGPPLAFSLAVPLPVLAAGDAAADSSGTMRGAVGSGLAARFAGCVYQLMSGRTPPPAAFVTTRAYQAIPRLTERSNRYLASAIAASQANGTCRDVIRGLAHEERIPGASHSSGLASASSLGPRTTTSWPASPTISLRSVPPSAAPQTPPVSPPQESAPAIPPPVPTGKTSAPSASASKRWIIPVAAVVVLSLAGAGWFLTRKNPVISKPVAVIPSESAKAALTPETVETPVTRPEKTPDAVAKSSLVKVPGDAATLAEALAACEAGGTIELAPGTYQGALVITRSVAIVAASAAVLESDDNGASVVTVRGPVDLKLRNIQIRSTGDTTEKSPESSPPLVLATDSAVLHLDGCIIERSSGSGISLSDKASATLSNCRIRNNRAYGINLTSGAKADVTLSELQQNGLAGISAMNNGTLIQLHNGADVSSNSRNGIEIGNGADLVASGARIKGNGKVGLVIQSPGTTAKLEASCVVSDNHELGIGVYESATLGLTDSTVEGNKEIGLQIRSGGQATVAKSEFRSNGFSGIYLENGSESRLTVRASRFISHPDAGIAVVQGAGEISQSVFEGNGMAVIFGDGASGSAAGNSITPGPLESALVTENSGEVILRDNTVAAER